MVVLVDSDIVVFVDVDERTTSVFVDRRDLSAEDVIVYAVDDRVPVVPADRVLDSSVNDVRELSVDDVRM